MKRNPIKFNYAYFDGYFDEVLSDKEQDALNAWIKADIDHARQFAEATMLHDRMRAALVDLGKEQSEIEADRVSPVSWSQSERSIGFSLPLLGTAASIAILCLGVLWLTLGQATASAASRELDRIIMQNVRSADRTYKIFVEQTVTPKRNGMRWPTQEERRPPKPSLDGATLHVGENNRFVLIRKTESGTSFITGSDGELSWAVNPMGPVRVSTDLNRFNRDLPGHESSLSLTNIHDGLASLRRAYDVQLSSLGPEEFEAQVGESYRLLTAVKKPNERGPQRVEIAYESNTGRIQNMRFVHMPYGPDRLDLRMVLVEENPLPPKFFDHSIHHASDRPIEKE
ncbi:MAG: hypothetical protein NTW52_15045 [Planctomycetota bacterium]|nr:hypothetical protein [Planctomycetota bacterium]